VISFVASNEGPAGTPPQALQHGVFAFGVLNALGRSSRGRALSLREFQTALIDEVLYRSNREQQVGCFVPRSGDGKNLILSQPFMKP
jgi:hypothetical protein